MSNKFGPKSRERISECHPDLQKLAYALIEDMDVTVLCGYRGPVEQSAAFNNGTSKSMFGQSPHNFKPALAIDLAPYPVDFNDLKRFDQMLNLVLEHAKELGIEVTLGRDFKKLRDYPHVELTNWRKLKTK